MIQVESLSFTYPGGAQPAVRDLSFTVSAGEVFAGLANR